MFIDLLNLERNCLDLLFESDCNKHQSGKPLFVLCSRDHFDFIDKQNDENNEKSQLFNVSKWAYSYHFKVDKMIESPVNVN